MFNSKLKNDALDIHRRSVERYDKTYENMMTESERLYNCRCNAIQTTRNCEELINSIANTPKEFETKMGLIRKEINDFRNTESFAEEALDNEIKSGIGIMTAFAAGNAFAGIAPSVALKIATTFGTASTGTAIKALSGAAAQKAALAWLGGGALSAGGAGVVGGQALLALAGPIGWSLSAASAGISLISLSNKNKKISEQAVEEAKKIMRLKENLDETTKKIEDLSNKTIELYKRLDKEIQQLRFLKNRDYASIDDDYKLRLGALVNNTLSMVALVNITFG